MDFAKLCHFYLKNFNHIKNPEKIKSYIITEYEFYKIRKQRLKLGTVTFDFHEVKFNNITITEWFEMKFSKQTSQQSFREKITDILKFISWAWDFKNIASFIIVLLLIIPYLRDILFNFYEAYFPSLALKPEYCDHLVRFSIETTFTSNILSTNTSFKTIIFTWSDTIVDLCTYFNLLF